jgi:hypothetical protein
VGAAGRGFDEQVRDQCAQGRGGWFHAGGPGRLEECLSQRERGDDATVFFIHLIFRAINMLVIP